MEDIHPHWWLIRPGPGTIAQPSAAAVLPVLDPLPVNVLAKTKGFFPGPRRVNGLVQGSPQFQEFLSSWNALLTSPDMPTTVSKNSHDRSTCLPIQEEAWFRTLNSRTVAEKKEEESDAFIRLVRNPSTHRN